MTNDVLFQVRQGDVYIREITEFPDDLERIEPDRDRGVVLAWGEATGHAHAIKETQIVEQFQSKTRRHEGNVTYLRVKEPVSLRHEEHWPIELRPGKPYIVIRQRELSEDDEWVQVAD